MYIPLFLGGSSGDSGESIAVDSAGIVYVVGQGQTDFPTSAGAYDEGPPTGVGVFVTKLNADGDALVYSTFLDGSSSSENATFVVVDGSGNAYVTGNTQSADFPTTGGAFDTGSNGGTDGFVTKVNTTGTGLVYSTYLGGSGTEVPWRIFVDSSGNAYLSGYTQSSNFPTTSGAYDEVYNAGSRAIFVTKMNSSGTALTYSTFIEGNDYEENLGALAVDSSGNAYVAGDSCSTADFPTTADALDNLVDASNCDGIVVKLNSDGSALVYSSFIGGDNEFEIVKNVALDSSDNLIMVGQTFSSDFPTTAGALDTTLGGSVDLFATKLSLSAEPPSSGRVQELQQNIPPDSPLIDDVLVLSDSTIKYSWMDQSDNEEGFRLLDKEGGILIELAQTEATSLEVRGLFHNTLISDRYIAAYNEFGQSQASGPYPDAVTHMPEVTVEIVNIGRAFIEVTINQTLNNLTVGQSGLEFELMSADSSAAALLSSGWVQTTSYTFSDLQPEQSYQVRVKARNQAAVETEWSQFLEAVTSDQPLPALSLVLGVGINAEAAALTTTDRIVSALFSNHVLAAVDQTISQASPIVKWFLWVLLAIFILLIALTLKNFKAHRLLVSRELFNLIRYRPQYVFAKHAPRAEDGTYLTTYNSHRKLHSMTHASFSGLLALAIMAFCLFGAQQLIAAAGYLDDGVTVKRNDLLTYNIEYLNSGSGRATNAEIRAKIPGLTSFVSGAAAIEGDEVVFAVGTIDAKASGNVSYQVQVNQSPQLDSSIANQARIIYNESGKIVYSNQVSNPIQGVGVGPEPELEPEEIKIIKEEIVIIEELIQFIIRDEEPGSDGEKAGEQPSVETTVRKQGEIFIINVFGTDEELRISGKIETQGDRFTVSGITSEPNTTVTIILDNNVIVIATSDEQGRWSTYVTAEQLGMKQGESREVKIDAIAAKGDLHSDLVEVGNVFLGLSAEAGLELMTDAETREIEIEIVEQVRQQIAKVVKIIKEEEEVIETTLTIAAPIVVVSSAPLWGYLPYLPTLIYHFITWLIGLLGRKKKKRFYGVVYDSISKQPLGLAIIRVYHVKTDNTSVGTGRDLSLREDKLVTTQVTDKHGRYDVLLEPGKYRLEVKKPQYAFPSKIVTSQIDGEYQHVYRQEQGVQIEEEISTVPDVPLDPANAEQQWQVSGGMKKLWLALQKVGQYIAVPILIVGSLISVAVVVAIPDNPANWILAILYVLMLLLQLKLRPKLEKAWGAVYDIVSNAVLPLATIQLIDPEYGKIVKSRLSDYKGRFSFLPEPGKYVVKANKEGYEQTTVIESPTKDRQPIKEEIEIKKSNQRINGDVGMRQIQ